MYQKDFILRMIEDFFRFLSIVLKLKGAGDYAQALDVIRETSEKLLKTDIIALSESEDDFSNFLLNTNYQPEQIEILAELLKINAEIYVELNQVFSAINAFEKSLQLYDQCQSRSKNYSIDRIRKMTEINLQLDRLREPLKWYEKENIQYIRTKLLFLRITWWFTSMEPVIINGRDFFNEFVITASRSSGAGGQNVNKVSTKVELRFHVFTSQLLTDQEKEMITLKLANKISLDGYLIIVSQTERSQLKNKEIAIEKFYKMIEKAITPKVKRKPTKPTKASKEKRLESKRLQAEKKSFRKDPGD